MRIGTRISVSLEDLLTNTGDTRNEDAVEKDKKIYIWMILVERPLPFFRNLSFLLSRVSTRRRVSLRENSLFLFYSFLCGREQALEGHRILSRTSSFAHFISLCKPLGFSRYQLYALGWLSIYLYFLVSQAFRFIADCIRRIRKLSRLLEVFGYFVRFRKPRKSIDNLQFRNRTWTKIKSTRTSSTTNTSDNLSSNFRKKNINFKKCSLW